MKGFSRKSNVTVYVVKLWVKKTRGGGNKPSQQSERLQGGYHARQKSAARTTLRCIIPVCTAERKLVPIPSSSSCSSSSSFSSLGIHLPYRPRQDPAQSTHPSHPIPIQSNQYQSIGKASSLYHKISSTQLPTLPSLFPNTGTFGSRGGNISMSSSSPPGASTLPRTAKIG